MRQWKQQRREARQNIKKGVNNIAGFGTLCQLWSYQQHTVAGIDFVLSLFLDGRSSFKVTFPTPRGEGGEAPWKFLSFASAGVIIPLELCFYGQENSKKEGAEENYITTFDTLKSGLICKCKKLFWRLSFIFQHSNTCNFAFFMIWFQTWIFWKCSKCIKKFFNRPFVS